MYLLFLFMRNVNRPARRPTIIKATTLNVPATADLFDQKPLEAAATFCIGREGIGVWLTVCESGVLMKLLLSLLLLGIEKNVDVEVVEAEVVVVAAVVFTGTCAEEASEEEDDVLVFSDVEVEMVVDAGDDVVFVVSSGPSISLVVVIVVVLDEVVNEVEVVEFEETVEEFELDVAFESEELEITGTFAARELELFCLFCCSALVCSEEKERDPWLGVRMSIKDHNARTVRPSNTKPCPDECTIFR